MLKYLKISNKNNNLIILSISLSTILLIIISLLFSSVFKYIEENTIKNNGHYHVMIISNKIESKNIKKITKIYNKYYIEFNNIKNTKKYTKKICRLNRCKEIKYNKSLLKLYIINKNSKTIFLLTITILTLTSFSLIYTSFSASYIQTKTRIETLKKLGMTNYQIKKSLLIKSLIFMSIGILSGLLISIWIGKIIIVIINYLLKDIYIFKLSINPFFILSSLSIIILSCLISSIIPLINKSKKTKIKKNKNKRIINKIAFSNYHNLKKQYKPITISLITAITILLITTLYIHYIEDSIKQYNKKIKYGLITTQNIDLKKFHKGYNYQACIDKNQIQIQSKKQKKTPVGLENYNKKIIYTKKLNCQNKVQIHLINQNINNFEQKIKKFAKKNKTSIEYINYEKANLLTKNIILSIKIILIFIITLISLITLITLYLTAQISIYQRKRQISILKSIGITSKEFMKMYYKETIYITKKAYIIIILIVIPFNEILVSSLKKQKPYIPYKQAIIDFIISFIVILISFIKNSKKIDKKNSSYLEF